MKLFTKISFIIAAIALGLGVLGVCVGMAMGADAEDLSEMGIHISPHHQLRVSGVITEMKDMGGHNHSSGEGNIYHSYSTVMEDIRRLEIDVQNAEIYIYTTEEEKLYFDSNRKKEIGKVEGKTLRLEESFSRDPLVLEIYIPIDLLREIEIKANGGILNANEIMADKISVEIDAGEVEINQLIVNKQADIHTSAGEIVVGYFEGPKLELDCNMGSVMIVCEGDKDDYNYELECGMGQITFDEESYSGLGEEIHINNGSNKLIEADCDMGEIILEFPNNL